ncbi:MAG TPA: glycosyltransferase [Candidatus Baltobacteraceae bacterium]|jgi:GT2 family glycosyltransferase/glycosyltransferase involved in cell wall biosynthesis
MNENGRYRELEARVRDERTRLESVRADYEVIMRSRFHALRMLWFSIKQLFGVSSPSDVYAAWSAGLEPSLTGGRRAQRGNGKRKDVAPTAALSEEETALISSWNERVAARAMSESPLVTVVIPFYDRRDLTVRCLQSIADSWFESLDVQFVLVDDGSTDQTSAVATRLDGVEYVRSAKNEGFVRACNRGAALARGKYVCFVNNDTIVRDGWLDYLVMTLEHDASVGIAGSKLLFPDGRLQEAGGILWRDATGWNVGRNEHADDPRYGFVRDVDYVSGASLIVRIDLFRRLNGFSEALRPAYYEDADLCFGARALGYRVVYQPRSVLVHEDGGSSTDASSGAKRFQEINRPKFYEKWKAELDDHFENARANVPAAMRRHSKGPRVLVVDSYVPLYDKEAGSLRLLHVVTMLRQAGYGVVFLPDNYAPLQPYTSELQQLGVEVLHHFDGGRTPQESLEHVLPYIDVAWISRTELYDKYEPLLRRNANLRIIYDTVDLSHVRKRRKAEVHGETDRQWEELQRQEASAARRADATIAVTPEEQSVLHDLGAREVFVVPTIHEPRVGDERAFDASSGLLFIGNYNHPPNVDGVRWLCHDVMPIVWRSLPNVRLTLLGSNAPREVEALAADRVSVAGYVRDVAPYFLQSRVFVAPLRFGAGMKGKIGQALEYALPVVTTPVGAEGLNLRDGENATIVAANPEAFAQAVVALYGDAERWQRYSRASAQTLEPFTPEWVRPRLLDIFDRVRSLVPQ